MMCEKTPFLIIFFGCILGPLILYFLLQLFYLIGIEIQELFRGE